MVNPPTRTEVREQLAGLAGGTRSPSEVDDWARPWVTGDLRIDDAPVWQAITKLHGADLLAAPGEILHGREDFQQWLSVFDAECANS